MAITDDFNFIGAAADNFDCDVVTGWTQGGNGNAVAVDATGGVDGGACLNLVASNPGECTWYHDVTAGSRFKITEKVLNMWFYYLKGKNTTPFIGTGDNAIVIRLYFGGTAKWADYYVAPGGDNVLSFGWQPFTISGKNLNGGVLGGTHNDGTDWELEIQRVMLVCQFTEDNDAGGVASNSPETPLRMDNWEVGTKLIVSNGTPSVPIGFGDLVSYSNGTGRTNGPLGVVQAIDTFVNIKCAIDVGNGSDGTNNEGNIADDGKFILFNQTSLEVKANLTVKNFSSLVLGTKEVGVDGNYAVSGCQIVQPASRFADISVENGGILRLFDCKVFRWRDIFLGAASDTGSIVELNRVQFDTCETVYFRATTLNLQDIEIYNNAANDRNQCAEMSVEPDSCANFLVHDCAEGMHFRDTLTIDGYFAQDNDGPDLGILSNEIVTIVNGFFTETNLVEVTS